MKYTTMGSVAVDGETKTEGEKRNVEKKEEENNMLLLSNQCPTKK